MSQTGTIFLSQTSAQPNFFQRPAPKVKSALLATLTHHPLKPELSPTSSRLSVTFYMEEGKKSELAFGDSSTGGDNPFGRWRGPVAGDHHDCASPRSVEELGSDFFGQADAAVGSGIAGQVAGVQTDWQGV